MTILTTAAGSEWWRSAVIYQIYPRSFADANGDGMGDLPGITSRLDSLTDLGVDAIWLSPFFTSPQKDAGYDVADYCDVDPLFGTLDDFDRLVAEAHARSIRIIVDLVPNHSSSEHEWFKQALAAAPGSPERARYLFRDGKGADGSEAPNNWESVFGGPAWTRVTEPDGTPGQWYLHLFDQSQPDFDWTNDEVRERFRGILRFWLDRGADGFRVDVAHGMIKETGLPDYTPPAEGGSMGGAGGIDPETGEQIELPSAPYWGQEGVHEIYRDWHKVLDEYEGERVLCAEAWVDPLSKMAKWVRPDEMQQAFNFPYLETPWNAADLKAVIGESLRAFAQVGAPSTWVLSNHDVTRPVTRYGREDTSFAFATKRFNTPSDRALGTRRARAAALLSAALPGSLYIYQGDELGLPEVDDIPQRQDPMHYRSNGVDPGRDGCRVPLPWSGTTAPYGFGPGGTPWLPQPDDWAPLTVEAQEADPASMLSLYRAALRIRRSVAVLGGEDFAWVSIEPGESEPHVLAFARGGGFVSVTNLSGGPVRLPASTELLLSSEPLENGLLPTDSTAWLRTQH